MQSTTQQRLFASCTCKLTTCNHLARAIVVCSGRAQSGILYPVVVRFENQNYAGVSTNNFGLDEVEPAKK